MPRQGGLAEGRLVAAWTVLHVSGTNTGAIDPPLQMGSLTRKAAKPVIEFIENPDEHYQQVSEAEAALRDHIMRKGKAERVAEPPPGPGTPAGDSPAPMGRP